MDIEISQDLDDPSKLVDTNTKIVMLAEMGRSQLGVDLDQWVKCITERRDGIYRHRLRENAETLKSLSVMLGWSNVPPREVLERSLNAERTLNQSEKEKLRARVDLLEDALQECKWDLLAYIQVMLPGEEPYSPAVREVQAKIDRIDAALRPQTVGTPE